MSTRQQHVMIVGGHAGIGKATARAALEAGMRVDLASPSEAERDAVRAELGDAVGTCVLDVGDPRAVEHCLSQLGSVDHLVVTAAEASVSPFIETDLDEAWKLLDAKFWAAFGTVQVALPYLAEGGSITLFSGIAASRPVRGLAVVAAANGAIEALTRALAVELCPLRVNAVAPGLVDGEELDEAHRRALANSLPVRRLGSTADVAHAVLFLIQNPYVTGTVLHLDGGKMIS